MSIFRLVFAQTHPFLHTFLHLSAIRNGRISLFVYAYAYVCANAGYILLSAIES